MNKYLVLIYTYIIFALIIKQTNQIMFLGEKTITIKGATITELWDTHADIAHWPLWQKDIEWTKVGGVIKEGTKFTLKPQSGPKAKLQIITYQKPFTFTDITYFPLAKMYTTTKMKEVDGGIEIKLIIKIKGLLTILWKNIVAKDILKGHQKQNENMVAFIKENRR